MRIAGVIWSVAKARARHDHNSGPLQVSKASLEVRDFPTDGQGQGAASDFALGARKVRLSCDGSIEGVQRVVCV